LSRAWIGRVIPGREWPGCWRWVAVLSLAAAAGCGTPNPYPPGSFERAVRFQERGKLRDAVAALDQFLRRDPPDSVAVEAQRMKAIAYMELKEYPLAAVEWQILRREYPGTEQAVEALYREGLAHLNQVGRLERDITAAGTARGLLRRYVSEWPDGAYAEAAREQIKNISDMFVRKKLGDLEVYRRLGREEAGAVVLDALLDEEPESRLRPRLLLMRASLAREQGEPEVAARFLELLLAEHPDSPEAATARRERERAGGGT
jgi:outer membrane assembly lipoprotein YfiO